MTLVIMAAGLGSRYGGLKQLDIIGPLDRAIIHYSIFDAIKAGFNRMVFIIKEENLELFKEKIGDMIHNRVDISYVFQNLDMVKDYKSAFDRVKPLGTGHALLCAKDAVGNDNFAVINADDFYGRDAFFDVAEFLSNECTKDNYCMVGYKLKNTTSKNGTVSRGVCTFDGDMNLIKVEEHEKIHRRQDDGVIVNITDDKILLDDTIVSMNLWGFAPGFFDVLQKEFNEFLERNSKDLLECEFYVTLPVMKAIENGAKIKVIKTDSKWYGMTYKSDREHVRNAILDMENRGLYKQHSL